MTESQNDKRLLNTQMELYLNRKVLYSRVNHKTTKNYAIRPFRRKNRVKISEKRHIGSYQSIGSEGIITMRGKYCRPIVGCSEGPRADAVSRPAR